MQHRPAIRRAVDDDEQLRSGFRQMLHDIRLPDVLADRQAKANAAERHGLRQRTGREHALLVEHGIVGQIGLEAQGRHGAPIEESHGISQHARLVHPDRSDQHRRSAIGGFGGKRLDGPSAIALDRRLQHQILRRVADDVELRQDQEVGAKPGSLGTRLSRLVEIAGNIAHDRVGLGECELQGARSACHGAGI